MRRATFLCIFKHLPSDNFYPRSPCGERPILGNPCAGCPAISIHALLAESDSSSALDASAAAAFLSTLSLRRATGKPGRSGQVRNHFYPRSPCGERLINSIHNVLMYRISIHALLAESDVKHLRQVLIQLYFYPRSPCGERLCLAKPLYASWIISIHALLAESDRAHFVGIVGHIYFYPRSPCGERPLRTIGMSSHLHFYPRSPCGERRSGYFSFSRLDAISIHALLAESDVNTADQEARKRLISIHALLAESDLRKVPILSIK